MCMRHIFRQKAMLVLAVMAILGGRRADHSACRSR